MSLKDSLRPRDSTRIILDPPTFSPPPEMRRRYLDKRRAEIDCMLESARSGVWKPVVTIANHVRGTGAMYGFHEIGSAAATLVKAVQNGDAKSVDYLEAYVNKVAESSADPVQ